MTKSKYAITSGSATVLGSTQVWKRRINNNRCHQYFSDLLDRDRNRLVRGQITGGNFVLPF